MARQANTAPEPEEGMTLVEHLAELRMRLFRALLALVIGALIGLLLSERLLQLLLSPYGSRQLLVTSPISSLSNVFVVSVTFGAILSSPVVIYQILAFVFPGLLPHERRAIMLGLPFGLVLFVLGAAFAFFVMLPAALNFLTGIFPSVFRYELTPDEYVPFVAGVMFWMGVAFEMPLIIFLLAKANVLNANVLIKQWRWAVVVVAVLAALITPTPDPINMSIVMVPLLLLYVFSIGMAKLARRNATVPAMLDPDEHVRPS